MWPALTVDEYAALERRLGTPLIQSGGQWWRRARPFFYRPLFPFAPLPPGTPAPTPLARCGGWQYPVARGEPANSHLNFLIVGDLQSFDGRPQSREDREGLRRARRLTLRRLDDLEEAVSAGHPVVRQYFERTGYGFRRDRLSPEGWRRWLSGLFSEPRVLVLGAYTPTGALCAIHVSLRVEDVILFEYSIPGDEGRRHRSSYGVLHYLRLQAAQTDAAFISLGPAGAKPGIDGYKMRRGARLLNLPARLEVNPLATALLRTAAPALWSRLRGMDGAEAERYRVSLRPEKEGAGPASAPERGLEAPPPPGVLPRPRP